ncbi:unnamed protein product [Lactuca saligna]|uniref:Uncharacterized protein n=1 Tax=Lactuca saligna TaxID=75948 RepID=A0AA35ZXA8_LACSI|nr:unnamed protein product [Lactuca saligna]
MDSIQEVAQSRVLDSDHQSSKLQSKSTKRSLHHPSLLENRPPNSLSTSIFGRHEPGQINTIELYFLYCMTSRRWSCPGFATFFLDKCDSIRTKTNGNICTGGLITLIGLGIGLQFPDSEYVPVDDPPLYLLDCFALTRMELLRPRNLVLA